MPVSSHPRDQAVQAMFDRIAGRYDLLNRIISFRLDSRWRKQAIASIITTENPLLLDLGSGTGDLTFGASKQLSGRGRVVALDFSFPMLQLAQQKRQQWRHGATISLVQGSALELPCKADRFDGAMSAFVLRNVSDLTVFFSNALRVLKPGGRIVTLDMFPPKNNVFSRFYGFYFYRLMPKIGAFVAKDYRAYSYLAESVKQFQPPENVVSIMEQSGFINVRLRRFLNGAVCMHLAEKPMGRSSPS